MCQFYAPAAAPILLPQNTHHFYLGRTPEQAAQMAPIFYLRDRKSVGKRKENLWEFMELMEIQLMKRGGLVSESHSK